MPKTTTILSAAMLIAGTLGAPSLVVNGAAEAAELQENINSELFKVMRLDPYAGMMRLHLTIPEGQTLKRLVTARPAEDRYRLMPELDRAATKILDGEAKELLLKESENLELMMFGRTFDNWVGFSIYDYLDTGVRFFDRNPADVMYVALLLEDEMTGEENKHYYKIDYRACAHEQAVLSGEAIMCETTHEAGKTDFVPEAAEIVGVTPTWEEELLTLAKSAAAGYFEDLEALEARQAGGEKIKMKEVEALEAKGEELGEALARFPEIEEIQGMEMDYATRVAALKRLAESDESDQEGNQGPSGTGGSHEVGGGSQGGGDGAALGDSSGGVAGVTGAGEAELVTRLQVRDDMTSVNRADSELNSAENVGAEADDKVTQEKAPELTPKENGEEMAVPKLGGSWWEQYLPALMVAGASLTGVVGWLLIGLFIRKRKHNER